MTRETLAVSISVPPSLAWRGLDGGGQRMMRPDEIAFTDASVGVATCPAASKPSRRGGSRGFAASSRACQGLALSDDPLYAFIDDCRAAGLEMAGQPV